MSAKARRFIAGMSAIVLASVVAALPIYMALHRTVTAFIVADAVAIVIAAGGGILVGEWMLRADR